MSGEIPEFKQRYRYLVAVVCLSFAVVIGRLWQVQIIRGEHFQKKSEDNFVQERRIPSVRGLILDRRNQPLVQNRPTYDVYITPRFADDESLDKVFHELALPPAEADDLVRQIKDSKGQKRFQPLLVMRDISRDQLAGLETYRPKLAGVTIQARAARNYLHGNLAAHVLGYMSEISAEELQADKSGEYQPGNMIGRSGVERMYEDQLRGVPGRERIVVDARGHRKRTKEALELLGSERRVEPEPGHNLVLTIDIEVQRLVERALRSFPSAAAVVLEASTGRILGLASKPAFDPNMLSGRLSADEAKRLLSDPLRPLLDKVNRENYFPGSTYKVIPAIAALEEGLVRPEEQVMCRGWHSFGRRTFRCSHIHGKVNLHEAIVESCNVYFYTLAEHIGMDVIARYAHVFGLGAPTGLGLNNEVAGFIPDKAWYARRKQPFRIGFTLNASIGQGNTKATPLQIANLYATIANGGTLYLPQVVERIETSNSQLVEQFQPRARRVIRTKPGTLDRIRAALTGVVNEEEGTAYDSRLGALRVAGKTGTAQVSRRAKMGQTIWLQDHSWFAAYAPSDHPVIAVAVLIEHGGRGAKVAAPVAMDIIKSYFRYVEPRTAAAVQQEEP